MNSTILDQILDSNRSYLAGTPKPLDDSGPFFLVVACIDPRLTGLLIPAMGLPRGRAMMVRIAGNRILPSSHDIQRSIAAALYLRGAREIFVVGHTDCLMAAFSAQSVIESFRSAGVPRSAFGSGDLREWFGAYSDIRANVFESIENLVRSGILPSDARVHGLIIDTVTGKLEILKQADMDHAVAPANQNAIGGSEHRPPLTEPATYAAELKPSPDQIREDRTPTPAVPKSHKGPIILPVPSAPGVGQTLPPESMAEAIKIFADFFQRERQNPKLRPDLMRLREILLKDSSPFEILAEIARIARENAARYPRVPGAIEYIASQLNSGSTTDTRIASILSQILRP